MLENEPTTVMAGQKRGVARQTAASLETVVLAGVEPTGVSSNTSCSGLDGKQRELWLNLLYEVTREPSMLASSGHLLYIDRKPD